MKILNAVKHKIHYYAASVAVLAVSIVIGGSMLSASSPDWQAGPGGDVPDHLGEFTQKAVEEAFTLSFVKPDPELMLWTEDGADQVYDAFRAAGNLDMLVKQQLVYVPAAGEARVTGHRVHEGIKQWRLEIPLTVDLVAKNSSTPWPLKAEVGVEEAPASDEGFRAMHMITSPAS